MLIQRVSSSTIRSIGYDYDSKTLEVNFTSGIIYRYRRVPPGTFEEFLRAPSKGQFLNSVIKEAGFEYYRVN